MNLQLGLSLVYTLKPIGSPKSHSQNAEFFALVSREVMEKKMEITMVLGRYLGFRVYGYIGTSGLSGFGCRDWKRKWKLL